MRGCGGYGAINGRMTSACPILSRRSVCQACDSRGADIRPDFPQARMGTGWRMVGPPRALKVRTALASISLHQFPLATRWKVRLVAASGFRSEI